MSKLKLKTQLPDTLSELARVAARDARKAMRRSNVRFYMGDWMTANGQCTVCLAGAVILCGGVRQDIDSPSQFDLDTENKLRAINALRSGDVAHAARCLNKAINKASDIATVPMPNAFATTRSQVRQLCADMNRLAKKLAAAGL